jgi:Family of unknown function (DUF6247)
VSEQAAGDSWLAALDDDDRSLFFAEMDAALDAAEAAGSAEPLETCLDEWRTTGRALSDPARREVLTGDGCGDGDFVEVHRP